MTAEQELTVEDLLALPYGTKVVGSRGVWERRGRGMWWRGTPSDPEGFQKSSSRHLLPKHSELSTAGPFRLADPGTLVPLDRDRVEAWRAAATELVSALRNLMFRDTSGLGVDDMSTTSTHSLLGVLPVEVHTIDVGALDYQLFAADRRIYDIGRAIWPASAVPRGSGPDGWVEYNDLLVARHVLRALTDAASALPVAEPGRADLDRLVEAVSSATATLTSWSAATRRTVHGRLGLVDFATRRHWAALCSASRDLATWNYVSHHLNDHGKSWEPTVAFTFAPTNGPLSVRHSVSSYQFPEWERGATCAMSLESTTRALRRRSELASTSLRQWMREDPDILGADTLHSVFKRFRADEERWVAAQSGMETDVLAELVATVRAMHAAGLGRRASVSIAFEPFGRWSVTSERVSMPADPDTGSPEDSGEGARSLAVALRRVRAHVEATSIDV